MEEIRKKPGKKKISRKWRIFLWISGILIIVLLIYGFVIEPRRVVFERIELAVPNLPHSWEGKKLVFTADIHSSSVVGQAFINRVFERINKENPHVIILGGDYITGKASYIEPLQEPASQLKASVEGGKIAVLGNHDYWVSKEGVTQMLTTAGFQVPVNEKIRLDIDGEPLYILGADDLWAGWPDMDKMLEGLDPDKDPIIMVSHNPDLFQLASSYRVPVTLAGHTHGGQVVIPFVGAPILPSNFDYQQGFYKYGGCVLYVNRGMGFISPPVRFLCPGEVTVFTLKRKK